MKVELKKFIVEKTVHIVRNIARKEAISNVNSCCVFIHHQPEVSDQIKAKLKK